ncbi:hypothetical protein DB818_09380 [Xanthomonas perforans]|uniref:Uncharacterized protein n=1 Tax=Xanthomonas perforans TaxID=442694 RepID=A0AAQ0YNS7_XANPE|nr:hypothetical protein Xcom_00450 [Xanthomonas axonopodis pv. commiphoreae]RXD36150.1 hypothetical protein DB757_20735 [Xanthomonas perforans]RXD37107.1 hypothetical protein DB854_06955 [Xanthomonas perforans]RXD51980.1 hypothetical protein DB769_15760 [Xanthomonas perforans]RXD57640.1 hypothetical protein DB755_12695 [Xanthomonas perforans]
MLKTLHTDQLDWSLPAHRRGTLGGMDAATELTGTYLQRVLRWWAGKDPAVSAQSMRSAPDLRNGSAHPTYSDSHRTPPAALAIHSMHAGCATPSACAQRLHTHPCRKSFDAAFIARQESADTARRAMCVSPHHLRAARDYWGVARAAT